MARSKRFYMADHKTPRREYKTVSDYWLEFYMAEHCTLCGNHGVIDSRGVRTPAGVPCGRLNWCICPNGQILRSHYRGELPEEKP